MKLDLRQCKPLFSKYIWSAPNKKKVNHSESVQLFWNACVGIKKSCCLFVGFFFITSSDFYRRISFLFYLTHGLILIFELQYPPNSVSSYCLIVLSSSKHADFSPVRAPWKKWSMEMEKKKTTEQLSISEQSTTTKTYELLVWVIGTYKTLEWNICI